MTGHILRGEGDKLYIIKKALSYTDSIKEFFEKKEDSLEKKNFLAQLKTYYNGDVVLIYNNKVVVCQEIEEAQLISENNKNSK